MSYVDDEVYVEFMEYKKQKAKEAQEEINKRIEKKAEEVIKE